MLKPGGTAIFMVYNRISWLNALSKVMKVALERGRALPAEALDQRVPDAAGAVCRGPHRARTLPVKSRLHGGWKGLVFNTCFVGPSIRCRDLGCGHPGWHLMAFCRK
ncbi:MAG: hypothetical protein R2712_29410 [Vicinamibacterales bacterium]